VELRNERDVAALSPDLTDATENERIHRARIAAALIESAHELRNELLRADRGESAVRPRLAARCAHGVVDIGGLIHVLRAPGLRIPAQSLLLCSHRRSLLDMAD
jgi:hypothetical protein